MSGGEGELSNHSSDRDVALTLEGGMILMTGEKSGEYSEECDDLIAVTSDKKM